MSILSNKKFQFMWNSRKLVDTLNIQQYLFFYKIMGYPVPKQTGYFLEGKKQKLSTPSNDFSRDQKNPLMEEYLQIIENYENIYKSIPFIEEIYLCNSISFNALHPESDIDLFIITQPNRIWTTKFRAMIFFFFKKGKRTLKKKKRRFCLSFFITSDEQNLYKISLKSMDIYLSYRIQHLVLLYKDNEKKEGEIFKRNKRIQGILPNYPQQQSIYLGNKVFTGRNKFKTTVEKLSKGIIGDGIEYFLKWLQLISIHIKKARDPERNKDVITTNTMLKFHQDIREKISLKYNIIIKKQ